MPAQRLDEESTCLQLVTPALSRAGWRRSQMKQEVRTGRIRGDGSHGPGRADYVLYAPRDERGRRQPVAVLEVKSESHDARIGAKQAAEYARALSVSAAFSTNGHDYVQVDVGSGAVGRRRPLVEFPSPEALLGGDTRVEEDVESRQRLRYQARSQGLGRQAKPGGDGPSMTPSRSTRFPSRPQRDRSDATRVPIASDGRIGMVREMLVRSGWKLSAQRSERAEKLVGRYGSQLRQFKLSTKKEGRSDEAALVLVVPNYSSRFSGLVDQAVNLARRGGVRHVFVTNGMTYKWRNLLSGVESEYLPISRFPRPGHLRADMPEPRRRGTSSRALWARLRWVWHNGFRVRMFRS